jgi:hypothetical protein
MRHGPILLFAAATLTLAAACVWRNHLFFHDDAYITLRYARHLAFDGVLAWNARDSPVEGFSSPLHVFLLGAALRLGLPGEACARVIGCAAHAVLTWLVWRRVRADAGVEAAWLACLLVGASFPLVVWDLGGLETTLFALAVFAALDAAGQALRDGKGGRKLRGAALLFGLAALVRPEAMMFASVSLGTAWLVPHGTWRDRTARIMPATGIVVCAGGLLALAQFAYFGSPVANTAIAKVAGIPLAARLWLGAQYTLLVIALPPFAFMMLAALAAAYRRCLADRALVLLCANIAAAFVAVTIAGGDHMPAARFLAPMIAPAAVALSTVLDRAGLLRRYALPLTACCVGQAFVPALNPVTLDPAALYGTAVGRYIAGAWPAGSLVALNAAGSVPYFADNLRYIDMLGLNDATIARRTLAAGDIDWRSMPLIGHLKGDGAYVLARQPDFIIAGPAQGLVLVPGLEAQFLTDRELSASPAFRVGWALCRILLPAPPDLASQMLRAGGSDQYWFTFYAKQGLHVPGCPSGQDASAPDLIRAGSPVHP